MEGDHVGNTLSEMHFIISVPFSLRIPFFGDYNLHTPILFCAGGVHLYPTWQTQAYWQQGFFSLLHFTDTLKLSTDALGSPQQPSLTTTPIYLLIKKKHKKSNIFHNYKEQFCIYLHYWTEVRIPPIWRCLFPLRYIVLYFRVLDQELTLQSKVVFLWSDLHSASLVHTAKPSKENTTDRICASLIYYLVEH